MSDKVELSNYRYIMFSGKRSEFPVWEEKILARFKRRGLKDVVLGTKKVSMEKEREALDKDADDYKAKIQA